MTLDEARATLSAATVRKESAQRALSKCGDAWVQKNIRADITYWAQEETKALIAIAKAVVPS